MFFFLQLFGVLYPVIFTDETINLINNGWGPLVTVILYYYVTKEQSLTKPKFDIIK